MRVGLLKSCSTCVATPHYPYPASFFALKRGAASLAGPCRQGDPTCPRMAGRQTGWGWKGEGRGGAILLVFIVLGPPYASWCTGPWVAPDCGMSPSEQAADLIFQHTAAPTSGPGEGDLPCLLECLLNWNRNGHCAKFEQPRLLMM